MTSKTNKKKSLKQMPKWNLGLLYKSDTDPAIEKDLKEFETLSNSFAVKYDVPNKRYIEDEEALFEALTDFEIFIGKSYVRPARYFNLLEDIDASNNSATAKSALIQNRLAKCHNIMAFFGISLGKIPLEKQKQFLNSAKLKHFKVFLQRVFDDAKHVLSVAEEKILNLKSLPAYDMWVSGNEKILNMKTVVWKKKTMPLSQALGEVMQLKSATDRNKLAKIINEALESVAPFSEAEINAVITNKKINDELRGYSKPYENAIRGYRNDPKVVERLVTTVTNNFHIAQRFYRLKAKLLKLKKLSYADRAAKIGTVRTKFPFANSLAMLKKTFGDIHPKFANILDTYIRNGQIDALPRVGKRSGAYCTASFDGPTFVLLNHCDDFNSFRTFAHEMGHAFHFALSNSLSPVYFHCSTALAETASTLFESIAGEAIFETLSQKEKIIFLHDKINDNVATIFRQIACFNFENELHTTIRAKGYMSKEEIADSHNRNMSAYLGPAFKLDRDDGYMFVQWSHIRRFFYVYTYAYGMLVSKALLRQYKKDKSFWSSIEKFLCAGGKDSPEDILKEIGIDVAKPDFWQSGLKEIEEDIDRLEKLTL